MNHADPRVRANVVESLWEVPGAEICGILRLATTDKNHRVAANGLIGLYRFEPETAVEGIRSLSAQEQPHSRAAAAFAMGKIADPQFLPDLARLIRDPEAAVRTRAIRAVVQVQRARGAA
jgi:HEAT repeat protein